MTQEVNDPFMELDALLLVSLDIPTLPILPGVSRKFM
jgi:hypothetical protein